jgi:hypothetical protein
MKISQSLIKSYYDYQADKECGILFEEKFIKKNPKAQRQPSEAMEVGIYFEYLCTGALPKSGEIPVPKMSYAGTSRQKLSAPFERATESAEFFKKIIEHYKIEIIEVGKYIQGERTSGVIDIYAKWDGKPCIIDLKYSGLYNDKWNDMGWEVETLNMKDSLMIQAVHYKKIWQETTGEDIDFYFFVFDSHNSQNAKIINTIIDESRTASHEIVITNTMNHINYGISEGFIPKPDLQRCNTCPLLDECKYALRYPSIFNVYY